VTDVDPRTDRRRLVDHAYASSVELRGRLGLYDFMVEPFDLRTWVVEQVPVDDDAHIIDVGCGPGLYLAALRRDGSARRPIGVDLSAGMCAEASSFGPTLVADAVALPFADRGADLVIAAHMLYHVADIDAALREFRRVLHPEGTLAIVLNGRDHLPEILELLTQSVGACGGPTDVRSRTFMRAVLDAAVPRVASHFARVTCNEYRRTIEVPDPDVVVTYLATLESLYGEMGVSWSDVLADARARVAVQIREHGVWRTQSHGGVLLASGIAA
jgi:ubiquinone/menaquinone biosynthesis C-methylase UbiE